MQAKNDTELTVSLETELKFQKIGQKRTSQNAPDSIIFHWKRKLKVA
jgi:hypothetical protein